MAGKVAIKSKGTKTPPKEAETVVQTVVSPVVSTPQTAEERTKSLLRLNVEIDNLEAQDNNPNEMGEAEFNLLYDNIDRVGVTDPILVRRKSPEEITETAPAEFKIVGGYHRWEVAKLHGFSEVPVTVITDPTFDADSEKFQIVRHNVIRGKMNPKKFMDLYQSLSGKYTEEVAAEMFGFANEEEFKKLVQSTAQALPPEMKQSFLDASKEIRTIDDLALVLNRLFTTYGDTVPYGYMIFDFGGQDHVWLRMKKGQKQQLITFGELCRNKNRSIDSGMSALMQLIAQDISVAALFEEALSDFPEVTITATENEIIPTEDYLASLDDAAEM